MDIFLPQLNPCNKVEVFHADVRINIHEILYISPCVKCKITELTFIDQMIGKRDLHKI